MNQWDVVHLFGAFCEVCREKLLGPVELGLGLVILVLLVFFETICF